MLSQKLLFPFVEGSLGRDEEPGVLAYVRMPLVILVERSWVVVSISQKVGDSEICFETFEFPPELLIFVWSLAGNEETTNFFEKSSF